MARRRTPDEYHRGFAVGTRWASYASRRELGQIASHDYEGATAFELAFDHSLVRFLAKHPDIDGRSDRSNGPRFDPGEPFIEGLVASAAKALPEGYDGMDERLRELLRRGWVEPAGRKDVQGVPLFELTAEGEFVRDLFEDYDNTEWAQRYEGDIAREDAEAAREGDLRRARR